MKCAFCLHEAVTVSYGFAICGGREETPINCSERARGLFERMVFEQAERAARAIRREFR